MKKKFIREITNETELARAALSHNAVWKRSSATALCQLKSRQLLYKCRPMKNSI